MVPVGGACVCLADMGSMVTPESRLVNMVKIDRIAPDARVPLGGAGHHGRIVWVAVGGAPPLVAGRAT